jgi:glycerophosphoryl diester phosphodiesterase
MRPSTAGLLMMASVAAAGGAGAETSGPAIVIQSHRGAGELAAENTIEAFELGWKLGTYPEADVRMTSDGVIVAFHDANFKRVTKDCPPELLDKGVADVTWEQLSALRVGMWKDGEFIEHRVPRIDEVLALMRGRPERHLYLDIKKVDLEQLAREVNAQGVTSQVVLASPDLKVIADWKALVPPSDTLLWLSGNEAEISAKLDKARAASFAGVTQLQVHVHMRKELAAIRRDSEDPFTPSDAFLRRTGEELAQRGILYQALPYGGSTPEVYWKLLDLGVKSFATDRPDVLLQALRDYTPLPARPE